MKTRTNHGAVIPIGEVNLPQVPISSIVSAWRNKYQGSYLPDTWLADMSPARRAEPNPYHVALEAAGHKLIRDKNGKIDDDQLDIEDGDGRGHSGPRCELCRKAWCIWCEDKPEPCPGEKQ